MLDRRAHRSILVPRWHERLGITRPSRLIALLCAVLLCACTSVGVHTRQHQVIAYGPPVQMQVCILRAPGVSAQRVDRLIAAVNTEFRPYGIEIVVPWVRPWTRPGFRHRSVFEDVIARELESPCDRLVAFVDRHAGDFVWGLLMPEVLGMVDDATHTRGFVVATRASLNQLLMSPEKASVHEFYHLLGCPHASALTQCYGRIAAIKRLHNPGADFFPGIGQDGRFIRTREAANAALRQAVAME